MEAGIKVVLLCGAGLRVRRVVTTTEEDEDATAFGTFDFVKKLRSEDVGLAEGEDNMMVGATTRVATRTDFFQLAVFSRCVISRFPRGPSSLASRPPRQGALPKIVSSRRRRRAVLNYPALTINCNSPPF